MCKKCLFTFLSFLVLIGFGFFIIFEDAKGALVSPIINEIAWAGSTNSANDDLANDEWIELYNPSDETITLTGWKLEAADGSPSIVLKGELPSGGYFLLERTDDTSVPNVLANQIYNGSLDNKGEDLKLIDPNGIVRDEVNASQGWPSGDNTTKTTMARDDTNLNVAIWGNGPANGTPLARNVLITSSPATQTPTNTQPPTSSKPLPTKKVTVPKQSAAVTQTPQQNKTLPTNLGASDAASLDTQASTPLKNVKDIAGAVALLIIGALAAFTIIKKRSKHADGF